MLYKFVKICLLILLPCKGTSILLFINYGATFLPAGTICATAYTISNPWVQCIYMKERDVNSLL